MYDTWMVWDGLGGGFNDFLFLQLPGEMIEFDSHIFFNGLHETR